MRVVILAPPGVQSLDVVGPAEVFCEAARRLGDPSAYEVQVMAVAEGPIVGTGSLRFLPDRTIFVKSPRLRVCPAMRVVTSLRPTTKSATLSHGISGCYATAISSSF